MLTTACCLLMLCGSIARGENIEAESRLLQRPAASQPLRIAVTLQIPADLYVYADSEHFFEVAAKTVRNLGPLDVTAPPDENVLDTFTGDPTDTVPVFKGTTRILIESPATAANGQPWQLDGTVSFQACSGTQCFMPQTVPFSYQGVIGESGPEESTVAADAPAEAGSGKAQWRELADRFQVSGRASGYMSADRFLEFLDTTENRGSDGGNRLLTSLEERAAWLVVLLVLLGGLTLNLTPCVLPMIPVNLTIIGAGAQAESRRRGFFLGLTYGGAIAAVYGLLGLLVVLTGATFGALNASPWFNLAVAVLFICLSLAMFDVFHIDLSKFSTGLSGGRFERGTYALAAFMGSVTALLAGACVAPVLIAVLLFSSQRYSEGNAVALLLPFVLGLGMALPWPFVGAGLSLLPKPGQWMVRVKYVLGVFILVLGGYYAYLGVSLLGDDDKAAPATEGWTTSLRAAMATSLETGKPVFVDFTASWCKNCHMMEKKTFSNERVQTRLGNYVLAKYQAEDPGAPATKAVLEHYGVLGLPTYIVLKPLE